MEEFHRLIFFKIQYHKVYIIMAFNYFKSVFQIHIQLHVLPSDIILPGIMVNPLFPIISIIIY